MIHPSVSKADDGIPPGKFIMFRCMIAMAHADGVFCDKEKSYIEPILAQHRLSAEQIRTLQHDFTTAPPVSSLLAQLNDPVYRGQVVHFAALMAQRDGVRHPNEEALLEKFRRYALDHDDVKKMRPLIKDMVTQRLYAHDHKSGGEKTIPYGEVTFENAETSANMLDIWMIFRMLMR